MSNTKRLLALVVAALLLLVPNLSAAMAEEAAATETGDSNTLVVGYSYFSNKFSPFFCKTDYDRDAADMTQQYLVELDREGNALLNGIEGETIAYNGVDHEYKGIADTVVTQNDDGTVSYDIKLRDDVVFSDGTPMTIDDVIFNLYVYLDPTYDGTATLNSLPITGLKDYTSGMAALSELIATAGEDNTDFTYFTEEQQKLYWDTYKNEAGLAFAQDIVDYCVANYGASLADVNNNEVALGMLYWGYGSMGDDGVFTDGNGNTYDLVNSFPTIENYWDCLVTAYDGDYATLSDTEKANSTLTELTNSLLPAEYAAAVSTGNSAANISGIVKTGDYSLTVNMDSFDAVAIYRFNFEVAPMHYYGDTALYDYENNMFGFNKGDLSIVKDKTTAPMGAGPFKFVSYENGVITYEKNENYFKGSPKLDYILFKEGADADKLTGVAQGTFDISDPDFSGTTVENLKSYNSNGDIVGDKITTVTVDNRGYGYIGINAGTVNVAGEPASDASKALRKAFMTVFSVYRDTVVDSYYGDRASVINYPISNTSWAAPRVSDEGYEIAYSRDAEGSAIYTDSMTETDKYAAALQAAVGYFKAAGYTFDDATGMFTAAPEGASMSYEIIIPADGTGDHPSYGILTAAKEALATIGITLEINDPANSNILWDKMDAGTNEMWVAAWQADVDPDMHQTYHSSNIVGNGGTDDNHYGIADDTLDELIIEARSSADQAFRKATYKVCQNIVLDWGVELPVYQRQNAVIFSTERVNLDTVTPDITTFWKWLHDLESFELK